MKKQIILSALVLLTLFIITGCENKTGNTNTNNSNSNTSSNKIKKDRNSVVLYFSATGTTKSIAKELLQNLIVILLNIRKSIKLEK